MFSRTTQRDQARTFGKSRCTNSQPRTIEAAMTIVPSEYQNISTVLNAQLAVFPERERFLTSRFAAMEKPELQFLDEIADRIIRIADPSIQSFCKDYR